MTRTYHKAKRAEAQDETREKIVLAAMALHLDQGVATTSYSDVAKRAGVGAATVYRHFPTMGSLVGACGTQVWQRIEPPRPQDASALFVGHHSRAARLKRLVEELDAFYARGAEPLWSADRDHDRVPELALFLNDVQTGVTALVAAALDEDPRARTVKIATALLDFAVWRALSGAGVRGEELIGLMVAMVDAAVPPKGAGSGKTQCENGSTVIP